jgi:hypothetical protein
VTMEVLPTDDPRSYHVSSAAIKKAWGFVPEHSIEDASRDLVDAFKAGKLPDAMSNPMYYNIKRMQDLRLK